MEAEEGSNSAQKLPMPSLEGRREAQEPQFWDRHARFPRRLIGLLVQRLEGGGRQRRCPRFPYDSYVPLLREQPHGGDAETPPPTPGGERSLSHESRPAAVPGPGAASRGLRDSANRPRVNPAGAPPSQMLGGPSSSGFLSPLGPADSPAGSGKGLATALSDLWHT